MNRDNTCVLQKLMFKSFNAKYILCFSLYSIYAIFNILFIYPAHTECANTYANMYRGEKRHIQHLVERQKCQLKCLRWVMEEPSENWIKFYIRKKYIKPCKTFKNKNVLWLYSITYYWVSHSYISYSKLKLMV